MSDISASERVTKTFGNKVRVRVCGLCIDNREMLLIKHINIGKNNILWATPGGGVRYGESLEKCLVREFKEETGLDINVKQFLFIYEFLQQPLHAIEIYFSVEVVGGALIKGIDPELPTDDQMIEEVRFCSQDFVNNEPPENLHELIAKYRDFDELKKLKGYFISSI